MQSLNLAVLRAFLTDFQGRPVQFTISLTAIDDSGTAGRSAFAILDTTKTEDHTKFRSILDAIEHSLQPTDPNEAYWPGRKNY